MAALAPAADAFDVAWYSGRTPTEGDWEQAKARCAAVRQLARQRQPGWTSADDRDIGLYNVLHDVLLLCVISGVVAALQDQLFIAVLKRSFLRANAEHLVQ